MKRADIGMLKEGTKVKVGGFHRKAGETGRITGETCLGDQFGVKFPRDKQIYFITYKILQLAKK